MSLTFGLTGMDPATESSLKAAFADANQRTGNHWQLLPETQAEFVAVDMDSMYGPMSWLRLHAAGKTVIGLTSAPRTQTDYRLEQPFDANSLGRLLQEIGEKTGRIAPAEGTPAGLAAAPQPQDRLPEEQPQAPDEETAAPPEPTEATAEGAGKEPPSAAAGETVPAAASIQPPTPAVESAPEPEPAPEPLPEPRTLTEWLATGRLQGRMRFARGGQTLLIDTQARQYHGPATLKPLAAHVGEEVHVEDFEQLDESTWASESAKLGAAQPLTRLVWYGALLGGKGALAPGFDPEGRFQMLKWPQTEREYPKHFRIATVMMKGPATLSEIAQASGVPQADVTDFVNANLATGYADIEHLPEPEPEAPQKSGLFGRFRR